MISVGQFCRGRRRQVDLPFSASLIAALLLAVWLLPAVCRGRSCETDQRAGDPGRRSRLRRLAVLQPRVEDSHAADRSLRQRRHVVHRCACAGLGLHPDALRIAERPLSVALAAEVGRVERLLARTDRTGTHDVGIAASPGRLSHGVHRQMASRVRHERAGRLCHSIGARPQQRGFRRGFRPAGVARHAALCVRGERSAHGFSQRDDRCQCNAPPRWRRLLAGRRHSRPAFDTSTRCRRSPIAPCSSSSDRTRGPRFFSTSRSPGRTRRGCRSPSFAARAAPATTAISLHRSTPRSAACSTRSLKRNWPTTRSSFSLATTAPTGYPATSKPGDIARTPIGAGRSPTCGRADIESPSSFAIRTSCPRAHEASSSFA